MLRNDLKIALRNLRLRKSHAILNITGLAVGIAGAILIFLFIQYHLGFDKHQKSHDRIYRVVLDLHLEEGKEYEPGSSLPLGPALERDFPQIEMTGFIGKMPVVTMSSESRNETRRFIEKNNTVLANQSFIEMFAFDWLTKFDASTMKEPSIAVISDKIAEKYFGTKDAAGKMLYLDHTIPLKIGAVFKATRNPSDLNFDILVSLPTLKLIDPGYDQQEFGWISTRNFTFVRLAEGSDAAKLEKLINKNGAKYYGPDARYYEHKLQKMADMHFDTQYDGKIKRSVLWLLAGVGAFLVIIASINFVNLSTAQAMKRAKEIGVRKALGSTRTQLFWQFMNETALITLSASTLSILLVMVLSPWMNNLTQSSAYNWHALSQFPIFLFWFLTMLLITVLAGFYPAVIISGFNPITALKGKSANRQMGGFALRRVLTTVQLVVAQILFIGAMVLLLQLDYFRNADLGFDQQAVVTIPLPKTDKTKKFSSSLKNELLQHSDISSVTYQYEAPASNMGYGGSVRFDNRTDWEKFVIRDRFADENYLETYKIPLLAGRSFVDKDSVTEFVINEELMKRLGINDPEKTLGKTLEDGNSGLKGLIVGVVKSFHLKSLQVGIEPCAIFPNPKLYKEVAVKINARNVSQTLEKIQSTWAKVYPDEVFEYQFVEDKVAGFYDNERLITTLIELFAGVAIVICCLGLFGTISFMVSQRTKEVGIRKVLGAGALNIAILFGKEFLAMVTIALVVSGPVACYLTEQWLNNFAYRIAWEWWIPASGGLIILAVTMLAIGKTVLSAALMNPVKSLKSD